jgi:hypothetical protein
MKRKPTNEPDSEIVAISAVYSALRNLEQDAQSRVLNYVADKLRISSGVLDAHSEPADREIEHAPGAQSTQTTAKIKEEGIEELVACNRRIGTCSSTKTSTMAAYAASASGTRSLVTVH